MFFRFLLPFAAVFVMIPPLSAGVIVYGDEDCLEQGCYGANDPTAGVTLNGLAPNVVTMGNQFAHSYPFSPDPGDFTGTDQIFVGNPQTGAHDGYSASAQRIAGPANFTLDYSSLVPGGQAVTSLTLGIAADDFQFPVFGQPFTVSLNGAANSALTTQIESLNESGPIVQFFSMGIDPALLTANNILTLSISEGGDGGDGYAIDFLTVGVTTAPTGVPEDPTLVMLAAGLISFVALARFRKASGRPFSV